MNAAGFEPTTFGFGIQCSASWATHPLSFAMLQNLRILKIKGTRIILLRRISSSERHSQVSVDFDRQSTSSGKIARNISSFCYLCNMYSNVKYSKILQIYWEHDTWKVSIFLAPVYRGLSNNSLRHFAKSAFYGINIFRISTKIGQKRGFEPF